jgi:hypothetical protein
LSIIRIGSLSQSREREREREKESNRQNRILLINYE